MSEYHGGWRMMRRYPGLWFIWSPGGRAINSLLWQWPPYKRLLDRLVARDHRNVEASKPAHVKAEEARERAAALDDLRTGRCFRLVNRELIPSETWLPDDPIQPDGWRHDGSGWVRA